LLRRAPLNVAQALRQIDIHTVHDTEKDLSLYQRIGAHAGLLRLLKSFYADVRQHRVIGPIFAAHIDDWDAHIAKIAEFWARATGGPSIYAGQMPVKHLALGLEPEHFGFWLELWDFNCRRNLAQAEAEEMSRLAHGIGARLRQIVVSKKGGWKLAEIE
jgi:hemoglobin